MQGAGRVGHKAAGRMTSLPDSPASGSSVLTNVPPPSALPSFLASPLPAAAPPTAPPPGPTVPHSTTVPPILPVPSGTFPASNATVSTPGRTFPPPGPPAPLPLDRSVPAFSSCTTASTDPSVPALRTNTSRPAALTTRPSVASVAPLPEMTIPPSRGVSSPATVASGSVSAPSKASSYPPLPPPPSSKHPTPPPASHLAESGLASQSSQLPQEYYPPPSSSAAAPVTDQAHLPNRQKKHSRHHSYPVYVPGNPLHGSPAAPAPPCLVVQQEQAEISLSRSHSHINAYSAASPSAEIDMSCSDACALTTSNSYYYAYSPSSASSANASASVDIGPSSVPGPDKDTEGRGWLGWIRGTVSNVGHRVAERAKTSMDSMITTLDPQMKEFIHSGGDMDIIVASDKEVKVGAIREAFQMTFGKATICGMKADAQEVAAQPVGFEAALNSAEGRINFLRSSGQIHPQQPIVAVENFIVEFHSDCWFDIGLLLLDDPGEDILLQTYTQVTPVPPNFIKQARLATPDDYPFKESGFAVTVGQIASQSLQVHHTMWQESLTGVSRREALVLAGRTLAGLYRSRLPDYH